MHQLEKLPRLSRFVLDFPDEDAAGTESECRQELFALALTNQIIGVCIMVNHLGLKPNGHGWTDGYDDFASAIVAVHLDSQYDDEEYNAATRAYLDENGPKVPDELQERKSDLIHKQSAAFDKVFKAYDLPKRSLLRNTIIYLIGL